MTEFMHENRRAPRRWPLRFRVMLVLAALGTLGLVLFLVAPNNARCPSCGEEFSIPEHRGMARLTRQHRCPNCFGVFCAVQFYTEYKSHHGQNPNWDKETKPARELMEDAIDGMKRLDDQITNQSPHSDHEIRR